MSWVCVVHIVLGFLCILKERNEHKLQSLPKQNLKIITCMVYAYVFEDPGTFLQGHNQLCIPSNYKKKSEKKGR